MTFDGYDHLRDSADADHARRCQCPTTGGRPCQNIARPRYGPLVCEPCRAGDHSGHHVHLGDVR